VNTATWPLVGRVTELTQVAAAMDTGVGGVLFAGPAGVGKSRLAFECLGFAAERGYRTAHVRANRSSATIPYGAFAALLPPTASTPALETAPQPVALTKREREVATLAARGLSSREIAGTIVVSTRTVENHLQRAYEKLGVSGRSELAEALGNDA